MYDVIIAGGGASGFFTANVLVNSQPNLKILILEKTGKTLSKVLISGGGRCNVTHNQPNQTLFSKHYPRGEKLLKSNLRKFGSLEMTHWLQEKGVELKTEEDNRMFPISNSSKTIVQCLRSVLESRQCTLKLNTAIVDFEETESHISVNTTDNTYQCKHLVLACGSSQSAWKMLQNKGVEITTPVPSLFTFTVKPHPLVGLSGISVAHAEVKIAGTKLKPQYGPLLITHKGFSGPAVLKLSAYAARELNDLQYKFNLLVNFTGLEKETEVREKINEQADSKKQIGNAPLFGLAKRLWVALLEKASIPEDKVWHELSKKNKNKLIEELFQGSYNVTSKNTFKDEFVTAGGIALPEIDKNTYALKKHTGVFATGEFLNIDGVTGGFNFQACWTSGYFVAKSIINNSIES